MPKTDTADELEELRHQIDGLRALLVTFVFGWGLSTIVLAKKVEDRPFHDHSWLQNQINDIGRSFHLHLHPEEMTHQ